jgi:lipopolysaccharide heptosyltransferase II
MMAPEWRNARRILCVRLDYLGDVLMSTPAIRALRESIPGAHITLLTSPGGAAAAPYVPEIDDTIVYQAPWLKSSDIHPPADDLAMVQTLAAREFDAAVIFTVYSQNPLPSALLCHLAGIRLRLAHCRENPYQLLTHWICEPEPQQRLRHEVRRQLDVVASVGARTGTARLSFRIPEADAASMRRRLAAIGIAGIVGTKGWMVVHPGASAASRRYPEELMASAACELAERTGRRILFTGNRDEAPGVQRIAAQVKDAYSLAGLLSLGELAALISFSPLLLTNNTGPAHIAAALGTPVVDLYALTNPQHAPWQVPSRVLYHDVPCRFCQKSVCPQGHQHCLAMIQPSRVIAACIELLEKRHPENKVSDGLLPAAW